MAGVHRPSKHWISHLLTHYQTWFLYSSTKHRNFHNLCLGKWNCYTKKRPFPTQPILFRKYQHGGISVLLQKMLSGQTKNQLHSKKHQYIWYAEPYSLQFRGRRWWDSFISSWRNISTNWLWLFGSMLTGQIFFQSKIY